MSMTWERLGSMLLEETGNTLLMTLPATFFAYLIGLPLGVLLVITRKDGILPKPTLNRIIGVIVNLLRSVPFIILMVILFPATRAILGRGTGTVSIIIPLTVSAFPYVARMVEGSLLEVDNGVVEAAQAMGSTTFQIVRKVLIPEAMPSLWITSSATSGYLSDAYIEAQYHTDPDRRLDMPLPSSVIMNSQGHLSNASLGYNN